MLLDLGLFFRLFYLFQFQEKTQFRNEALLVRPIQKMDYKRLGLGLSHRGSSFICQPFHTLELSYQVEANTYQDQDLSFGHSKAFLILFLFCTTANDGVLLKCSDCMLQHQVYSLRLYSFTLFLDLFQTHIKVIEAYQQEMTNKRQAQVYFFLSLGLSRVIWEPTNLQALLFLQGVLRCCNCLVQEPHFPLIHFTHLFQIQIRVLHLW